MRRSLKSIALVVGILFVGFIAGYVFHRNGMHRVFPGRAQVYYFVRNLFPIAYHFYSAPAQGKSELFQKDDVEYSYTFVVYGDSQEPARNGRELIVDQVVKENPKYVIRVGDIVAAGNEHQWRIYDHFGGKLLNDQHIPVYPVLGNHEYLKVDGTYIDDPGHSLQLYFERFPHIYNNRWYTFRYGNIRFIMMDTNTDYSVGSTQYDWLTDVLTKDDSLFKIMVFHHSPYTKSFVKERKEEQLITGMIENNKDNDHAKVDIVFTGHTHNYERYENGGVNYIVTGGGGAFPHLLDGVRSKEDPYNKPGAPVHYCRVTVHDKNMIVEMIELNERTGGWEVSDSFSINKG